MLDNTASGVVYRGGENQSVFPIPFPFSESSHIRASVRDAAGKVRALSPGSDYAVNMISDGHGEFILLGRDLEDGCVLSIVRLLPLTQDILFHNQGPNSPAATEAAVDKLTMIAQQLDGRIDRCLTAPEEDFSGYEMRLSVLEDYLENLLGGTAPDDARLGTLEIKLTAAEGKITALSTSVNSLGAMSRAADAPADGKQYARRNSAWAECEAQSGSGTGSETGSGTGAGTGGAIVGEIRLLPFRAANLPAGWYFCNGDRFSLASDQGDVLNSLPALFKTDWGISASSGNISLPNLFSGSSGYFFRAVNNSSRNPGNKQTDAMRNITGFLAVSDTSGICLHSTSAGSSTLSGAFYSENPTKTFAPNNYGYGLSTVGDLSFDASRCVPVAAEFRPMNVGMTPAIYLGV